MHGDRWSANPVPNSLLNECHITPLPQNAHSPFRFQKPFSTSPSLTCHGPPALVQAVRGKLLATHILNLHKLGATLINPLDLEIEEAMGTFGGQLGSDVSVTPVPLAAFHRLARRRRGFTRHLPLLVNLKAALLVDVEAIVDAQRGETLLAFAVVLVPTGEALTHTHVKLRVDFGLLICKGEAREENDSLV